MAPVLRQEFRPNRRVGRPLRFRDGGEALPRLKGFPEALPD